MAYFDPVWFGDTLVLPDYELAEKLAEIEDQLADCRARRKAAILRVSQMMREG